jgi:hypothetical protein
MSAYDDYSYYQEQESLERFLKEQFRELAEGPVFAYLARFGDAIEKRVELCVKEAKQLSAAGFYGAALARSAAGIEISIRFFLARPLVQGAFLSDEWAALLSAKVLSSRTAEDRELLPAILRNWGIDITKIKLADGTPMWEQVMTKVWPQRNDYVHAGATIQEHDADIAAACLETLLAQIVTPLGKRLGFSREQTKCWSIVAASHQPDINPPRKFNAESPFTKT